jgi:hypothetical protein
MRKSKMDRDESRDVSEKIALGMLKGTGKLTGEAVYDSRLFNQSSGMDSGFGAEDDYTAYNRPLFNRGEGEGIYRPKGNDSDVYGTAEEQIAKLSSSTSKFRPDKGFKGADGGAGNGPRDAPVQFEKSKEADPYRRGNSSPPRRGGRDDSRDRGNHRRRDDDSDSDRGGRSRRRDVDSPSPRNKRTRHGSDDD